jgi:hypothetical protein
MRHYNKKYRMYLRSFQELRDSIRKVDFGLFAEEAE